MAVTATFDEATGNLILKPQVADVWSYGGMEITEALCGIFSNGEKYTSSSDYTLFTASMNGNTATLTPGAAPEGNFDSFMFYESYNGGGYAYGGHYVLPNTITKASTPSVARKKVKTVGNSFKTKSMTIAPKPADLTSWKQSKSEKANVGSVVASKEK